MLENVKYKLNNKYTLGPGNIVFNFSIASYVNWQLLGNVTVNLTYVDSFFKKNNLNIKFIREFQENLKNL